MSRLAIYLLGPPRVERDGEPLHLPRRKALALLVYLAVTGRSHSRDTLATLFWPESDQSGARAELRRTLSLLNRTLGSQWLAADRETAGVSPDLGPAPDAQWALWLDVQAFQDQLAQCATHDHPADKVCPDCLPLLETAAGLYQDDFLAGFTLEDSAAFDEWQFFQTQALRDALTGALGRLVRAYSDQGARAQAIPHARRRVALDPLHEPAHRDLIQLYARSGQRTAALRQYRECVRVLEQELGVPPSAETAALYQQIRAARAPRPKKEAAPARPAVSQAPPFLRPEAEPAPARETLLVARDGELAALERHLAAALAGQGGVVWVTGDAGQGKTALLDAFARRAMDAHPDLLVVAGNCNAYSGLGDPYLPFREVLAALTGDVEARWAAGAISSEHARRLWAALPAAAEALLERGPALIDTLLPGRPLLARAAAAAPQDADWLPRLQSLVEGERPAPGELAQSQLCEQLTAVLHALSARHPLLLLLDDLQWADRASVSLLFHLGPRLAGSRVLLAGAYRPEEVALERDGAPHPLETVLGEFKRRFGDIAVDLAGTDQAQRQRFVDAFLDSEPNRLGAGFRRALLAHTEGHALFTVELLRAMQERGDLVQDEEGLWVEGPGLDWDRLPPRVEGVIEARIGRLEAELRHILSAASVEGEAFTAQVVAALEQVSERRLLGLLSRELEKRHRLVREEEALRVGAQRLARYRFAHALFQQVLYRDLGRGERTLLHGEVAEVLEGLYAGRTDEIVVQLAHHYAEAGQADKAVEYLDRAGDRARLAYAHQEAVTHYERALDLLKAHDRDERAARMLMKLGLTYHHAFHFAEARRAYEEGFALWQRAGRTVSAQALPPAPHALRVLGQSWDEPSTLDPAFDIDSNSNTAIQQLFSGLAALSPELTVEPDLAERWEVLDAGRKYVFHLREDARWSDGVPVTAADFEYAWKRILDPVTRSLRAEAFYAIRGARAYHQGEQADPQQVGVRAVDERTLAVELEDPTGELLYLVTHPCAFAVPRHAVQAYGPAWTEPDRLVTDGPFRLAAWERGGSLSLERSPTYHGRSTGNVERVHVFAGPEHGANALQMYDEDRLDVFELGSMPWVEQDRARQRHAAEYVSQPMRAHYYVGLDVSRPPFDDRRVRRALAMAIDRETMAHVVCRGLNFPADGGFWPAGMGGHDTEIVLPYDPEGARRLLADAGYPDGLGFPTMEALAPDNPRYLPMTGHLQAQWSENLEIDVRWTAVGLQDYFKRVAASAQKPSLWYGAMGLDADRGDAVSPIESWHTVGWRNEAYERLAEESRRAVDLEERLRIRRQADRILLEEVPAIILLYQRWHFLVKPWVTRLPLAATGGPWWKDVIIEPHET